MIATVGQKLVVGGTLMILAVGILWSELGGGKSGPGSRAGDGEVIGEASISGEILPETATESLIPAATPTESVQSTPEVTPDDSLEEIKKELEETVIEGVDFSGLE